MQTAKNLTGKNWAITERIRLNPPHFIYIIFLQVLYTIGSAKIVAYSNKGFFLTAQGYFQASMYTVCYNNFGRNHFWRLLACKFSYIFISENKRLSRIFFSLWLRLIPCLSFTICSLPTVKIVTSLLIRRELVLCEKSHYHTAIILGMFALPLSNVSNDFLYKIKDFFLRGADQTKVSSKVSLTRVDMDNRQISRCVVFLFVWVRAFPSCKIPEAY